MNTWSSIMRATKTALAALLAIPILWLLCSMGWLVISIFINEAQNTARMNDAGYDAILEGCRTMTQNYLSYTNESHSPSDKILIGGTSSQNIPPSLRLLKPQYITLTTNRVTIYLDGPPRFILLGCTDDRDPGSGWTQLTNRLWKYTGS